MKLCNTLICFFLSIQHGATGETHKAMEGANITVKCSFRFSGSTKWLCKEICEGENILIKTKEDRAQIGRYSISYENGWISSPVVNVRITGLKTSDSGRYRCALDNANFRYDDFYLTVTSASTTSEPTRILQTFTSTFQSSASVTTAVTLTAKLDSSSSSSSSETIQQNRKTTGSKHLLLYVGLMLVALIIMLAAALLIFVKKKNFTQKEGPPMETDPPEFTMASTVYEEIREVDIENKPNPGEISSVCSYVKFDKPNGAESNDIYSLATGPQNTAGDDEVNYSEVHLSNVAPSSGSGYCSADNVIYSEAGMAATSANHGHG